MLRDVRRPAADRSAYRERENTGRNEGRRVYDEIEESFAAGDHRGAQRRLRRLLEGSRPPSERRLRRLCGMCRTLRRRDRIPDYTLLATELHRHLFADDSGLAPIVEGGMHAFCGHVDRADGAFVKVVDDGGVEARFYRLVLDGELPWKGARYQVTRPHSAEVIGTLSVLRLEAIAGDFAKSTGSAVFTNRKRAIAAARAIAEFNAQITMAGRPAPEAVPLPLVPLRLDTKHDAHLGARLAGRADLDAILDTHRQLQESWDRITGHMQPFTWAIANNDFHPGNFIAGKRFTLVDNGASCFAPLGNDLYSLIVHNIDNPELREDVIAAYCDQLRDCGVHADPDQVRFAANVAYCKRYMKMRPHTTTDNPATFLDAQAVAQRLLQAT